jgi:exosortase A
MHGSANPSRLLEALVTPNAGAIASPRLMGAMLRYAPVLAAALAVVGLLAVYWQTAASIVAIWERSQTFAHGFLVVPICLWLAWRRRDALAQTAARPWWPGLVAVFISGALWFVMSKADVLGVKQFALAFMIQASIVTILGLQVSRALLFPLAFFLFAIPAGEFLVPVLMEWTANFTVAAIRWSGVPVYREANHFALPSGNWSIVEACSGVRYLIASVMVGTIYAAIAYRSVRRRAAFVAASIVVPIIANWLRAYGIVMIGHLSNNRLAVGVDHLIYGWVFFGVVMLILFWVGSFWQEAPLRPEAQRTASAPMPGSWSGPRAALFAAAFAAIFAAGFWKAVDAALEQPVVASEPVLPAVIGEGGWVAEPIPFTDFKPHYLGAASELQQTFRKNGQEVGLYVAFYRRQEKGRELVTSGNALVTTSDPRWVQLTASSDSIPWDGKPVTVYRAQLSAPNIRLEAFRLYWVNGRVTASDYFAKGLLAWSNITGRGDDSALIVLYAPAPERGDGTSEPLRDFAAANAVSIEQALAATQRGVR